MFPVGHRMRLIFFPAHVVHQMEPQGTFQVGGLR